MKIRTILIDDEPKLTEVLNIKLSKYCPNISVIAKATNAKDAYELILENKPDLIFLDISMPIETGFDLLNKFENIFFETIFVTSFNEFAIRAFKMSAIDYLLKPLETSALKDAVKRATGRINQKQDLERYNILKNNIAGGNQLNKRTIIPSIDGHTFVEISAIVRFEGWEKYTKVFLDNGDVIVSTDNIGKFVENLVVFDFFQTHKSHLINVKHMSKYLLEGAILLKNGDKIPLSRMKKEGFIEKFIKK